MTKVYLVFAVLGAIIPFYYFESFLFAEGVNLTEFVRQLFANSPASGFTADLLIASEVFWIWSFREARQRNMKHWWAYVALNLCIGLSCALPLFLYFRERGLEAEGETAGDVSELRPEMTSVSRKSFA